MVRGSRPFSWPVMIFASCERRVDLGAFGSTAPSSGNRNFNGATFPVGLSHRTISIGPSA